MRKNLFAVAVSILLIWPIFGAAFAVAPDQTGSYDIQTPWTEQNGPYPDQMVKGPPEYDAQNGPYAGDPIWRPEQSDPRATGQAADSTIWNGAQNGPYVRDQTIRSDTIPAWDNTQNGQIASSKALQKQLADGRKLIYIVSLRWAADDPMLNLREAGLEYGYTQDYLSGGDWSFQLINRNQQVLEEKHFSFTNTLCSDTVDSNGQWSGKCQNQYGANLDLTIPFHDDTWMITIYDGQGNVRFTYDLSGLGH